MTEDLDDHRRVFNRGDEFQGTARDEKAGPELVFGELLISDKGGRRKLLDAYEWMHQATPVPHGDVVAFVRERRLHDQGVGWADVHLLASTIVGRYRLWTADPRL